MDTYKISNLGLYKNYSISNNEYVILSQYGNSEILYFEFNNEISHYVKKIDYEPWNYYKYGNKEVISFNSHKDYHNIVFYEKGEEITKIKVNGFIRDLVGNDNKLYAITKEHDENKKIF